MNKIDVRFTQESINLLYQTIGRTLLCYKHDPFMFSTSVYGTAGLCFEDISLKITNLVEVQDYYGQLEDVAIFKIQQADNNNFVSMIENSTFIETPVHSQIKKIILVNEHQSLYKENIQLYDVQLTRGIIIEVADGLQISFEKNIWFSEDISIQKGYDLLSTFSPSDEFCENWGEPYEAKCEREYITLE